MTQDPIIRNPYERSYPSAEALRTDYDALCAALREIALPAEQEGGRSAFTYLPDRTTRCRVMLETDPRELRMTLCIAFIDPPQSRADLDALIARFRFSPQRERKSN